ncbi:MAG TPA: DUF1579 domain-containing protein [Planctomycetota bacterium]|nr:DUF1579 domain-containing protein [Planctomycetota bacterium]
MKRTMVAVSALALAAGLAWSAARAQEGFQMPQPQKEHELLRQFTGTWDCVTKWRMGPDAPWEESKGTDSSTMLGGFWLMSEVQGSMMKTPFQGRGTTGYDPYKKKYVTTWVDSMAPVLSLGDGSFDASGKVLTMNIDSTDCASGKPCKMRGVHEIKDKDTTLFTMYFSGPDGKEFPGMTIEYKRRK